MFKLVVVLSALVAAAVAKPSLGYSAYAAPLAVAHHAVPIPTAVSHSYRHDVISKPIVATFAHTPAVVAAPVAVEPVIRAAPIVERVVAAPVARTFVAQAPVLRSAVVAAPLHHRAAYLAGPSPLYHHGAVLPTHHNLAYAANGFNGFY